MITINDINKNINDINESINDMNDMKSLIKMTNIVKDKVESWLNKDKDYINWKEN